MAVVVDGLAVAMLLYGYRWCGIGVAVGAVALGCCEKCYSFLCCGVLDL